MNHEDHTLSPACWCAPIVAHVQGKDLIVQSVRDADRLAELGVTQNVVVSPHVPGQRGGGGTMTSGGEVGDAGNPFPGK